MPAARPALPLPAGWTGRRLATGPHAAIAGLAELTRLFATDPAHFHTLYGWTPAAAAADTLDDLPRGGGDKWVVLLEAPGTIPIGAIELIEGYPQPEIWYLGLIFLVPAWRCAGHGRRWLNAIGEWIAFRGGRELRLAVVAGNPDAKRLYERLGYVVIREGAEFRSGNRRDHCFVMARRLG